MIINKKASQHLEMIMAFIIFSSFIFFLLYFLPLPKNSSLTELNIISLQNSFENMTQTELIQISLKTNSSNCFLINLQEIPENYNSIVKTDKNQETKNTPSYSSTGKISINSIQDFFIIYLSDEFSINPKINCDELPATNYTIGGIEKTKKISYTRLSNFIEEYKTNYESLKESMEIPANLDFIIKIKDIDIEDPSSSSSNILAKTKNYEAINSDGTIKNIEITFKLWS